MLTIVSAMSARSALMVTAGACVDQAVARAGGGPVATAATKRVATSMMYAVTKKVTGTIGAFSHFFSLVTGIAARNEETEHMRTHANT